MGKYEAIRPIINNTLELIFEEQHSKQHGFIFCKQNDAREFHQNKM